MLKRIRIRNYKSLKDVEVTLEPLTVLFGPNAVGKSNFLDALQLLSRIVSCRTIKTAFDPPYRGKPLESYTIESGGLEQLMERESMVFSIEVDVEISDSVVERVHKQINDMRKDIPNAKSGPPSRSPIRERHLRYRVEVEILPKTGVLRIADESLTPLTARGEVSERRFPFLSRNDDTGRLHLRMEGQSHPSYYERGLDHSVLSLGHYAPHHPHIVAFREEVAQYAFFYFEPRERMRSMNPVREIRQIGTMGEDLPSFLNTLQATNPLQFRGIERALHAVVPSITGIEIKLNHESGEVDLWLKEGERRISSRVVSEGTLRILGLLAIFGTKECPSLIGFEEPENGIPPRQIGLIAEMLKAKSRPDRQIIVTTHSPILPDYIPNASLFSCQKSAGMTIIKSLRHVLPLFKKTEIADGLDDDTLNEMREALPISQRMIRGDFDD